jgi:antitoxin VapB
MKTAKLFQHGQSQAVCLPDEFRFQGDEVCIKKTGHTVILFPKDGVWETHLDGLNGFTDDFMSQGRDQGIQEDRLSVMLEKTDGQNLHSQIETGRPVGKEAW